MIKEGMATVATASYNARSLVMQEIMRFRCDAKWTQPRKPVDLPSIALFFLVFFLLRMSAGNVVPRCRSQCMLKPIDYIIQNCVVSHWSRARRKPESERLRR